MTTLRALARAAWAGAALATAHAQRAVARLTHAERRRTEAWWADQRYKAAVVGYRGPIDPGGQWIEDLSAGRIDHDGRPRP